MSEYFLLGDKKFITDATVARPPLWRVLHEKELLSSLRATPLGMPEVRPLFPNHYSDFGQRWQLLSRAMNPRISDDKWRAVYGTDLWMTNYHGFFKNGDPRANYVHKENLQYDNPRVEGLTTGGSILTGYVEGTNLVVQTLDVNSPPSLDWIMARPWFHTYAVSCDGLRTPRRFPQGLQPNGEVVPIIHPLICNPRRYTKITIPLWRVAPWNATELPDPFRVYL